MSGLLFADDAVLIIDSEESIQRMVNEMEVVYGRGELKFNVNECKIIKVSKSGDFEALNMHLNGKRKEELEYFRYLGVDLF